MRHYCTLFDSKYLPQGLVLYESLKKHSSEPFTLHILPMDQACWDTLAELLDPPLNDSVHMTPLDTVETRMKLRVGLKEERSWQEYCWTMASQHAAYIMDMAMGNTWAAQRDSITYLDADMMFFSDPKVIHDEIGDRSIAVIPHRLIPSKRHLEVNGKFNVSWVTFKNNPIGRECLSTWAWQCREKCSATDGCGDQKYLDAWPDKYGDELAIIQNIGAGLAPWNLANYELSPISHAVPMIRAEQEFSFTDVVFYHYHEYIHAKRLTNYELRPEDIRLIYEPYIAAIDEAKERIGTLQPQHS